MSDTDDKVVLAWAWRIYDNGGYCATVDGCAEACELTNEEAEQALWRLQRRGDLRLHNPAGVFVPQYADRHR
jgi:hypothetical protein